MATVIGKTILVKPVNRHDSTHKIPKITGLNPLIDSALNAEKENGAKKGVDAFKKIKAKKIVKYSITVL